VTKLYVGDVGTQLQVDVGHDITSATSAAISVKKPDGTIVEWAGTPNVTRIDYNIQANDFDQEGTYYAQALVVLPTWSGRGETFTIQVDANFA